MINIDVNNPPISDTDWLGYNEYDLDEGYAHGVYFGLSYQDFLKNIENQSIQERCFELRYLPLIPFKYYALIFIKFFLSQDFDLKNWQNEYILETFLSMIISRSENDKFLVEIWDNLEVLLKLIESDKKYSLYEEETYEELIERINELKRLKEIEETDKK